MEGKGTYGIVYSNPRFPFLFKINFMQEEIKDDESIKNLKQKDEVSKIFFEYENYLFEKNNYLYLFSKYNLPDIYFNKPLHFGSIDENEIVKSLVYTYNWGGFRYDFKKIISNIPFQITFPKGKEIFKNEELTIEEFYSKSLNLINCIKYLNENNLIYDDLKLSNILEVNEIYKISDFSSIINVNELKTKLENSFLENYFYYIYLPILNQTLVYYLNDGKYQYHELYDNNYKESEKYIKNLIYKLFIVFEKYTLDIDFIEITKNKMVTISIYKILKQLLNFRKEKNNNEFYFDKFIEYLDSKYGENNGKKIEEISERMNLFSLGIFFLNIFNQKNNFLNIFSFEDSLQIKILVIIAHLILNFIKIDDEVYIFKPNMNDILEYIY